MQQFSKKFPALSWLHLLVKNIYYLFIEPNSQDEDAKRQEFILNVILFGALILSLLALIGISIDLIAYGSSYAGISPLIVLVIFIVLLSIYRLSRARRYKIAAYALLLIFLIANAYMFFAWGVALPSALFLSAMIIVMTGILLSAKVALFITLILGTLLILLSYLETHHIINPNYYWLAKPVGVQDGIAFASGLAIVSLVGWLSSREVENSLKRARSSEAALKLERDLLEVKVEERTRQLKQAQLEKMLQVYQMAEFGKVSSGLLHDMMAPLTSVSINLKELNQTERSALVQQAVEGVKKIEGFIQAARRQVQRQEETRYFSAAEELKDAVKLLTPYGKENKVKLTCKLQPDKETELYGNVLKFHQILTNLITNAVDAYGSATAYSPGREVRLRLKVHPAALHLYVHNWGEVIPPKHSGRVFEPFYTTKASDKGTGIGLSITKNIIENDFGGSIDFTSSKTHGTEFHVTFPLKGSR